MTDPSALDVRFEDGDLLVIAKPAGIVVHPSYKNADGTLLDALRLRPWADGARPSIVGRLDKGTSGLVVVAKHARAHAQLQRALAAADAQKLYLAIVRGVPPERGVIDLPLAHDPADRRRRQVSAGGAPSVTEFERLGRGRGDFGDAALLRCRLRTGRRHQIRVHLAARGWPIVGDTVYGEAVAGVARHALHAWQVAFTHPASGERVDVEAPPPRDFCGLLHSAFAVAEC